MSFTIESSKETGLVQANVIPKPLILCQLSAVDGDTVYLTTTPALGGTTQTYGGNTYQARLLSNIIEQIQAQSPQGYDIPGSINLTIDDSDFVIWNSHANAHGWRGGTLTVLFVMWDIPSNAYSTNAYTWTFISDKPTIDGDTGILKVAAQARQSMTRVNTPNTPRQNRCSHTFPATQAQRIDALTNPTSIYYACGYSPDVGGPGNTTTANLTNPDGSALTDGFGNYVTCDYTRSCGAGKGTLTQGCMARMGKYSGTLAPDGDLTQDNGAHPTARFDGDTWIAPTGWQGKQYVNPSAGTQYGFNATNPATGTTYYNLGYGTLWVDATVLAPAGDPNSTRAECVVCVAPIGPATIMMVEVNGVIVNNNNPDLLFTYRILSAGGRNGFISTDAIYNGQGDPGGSLCKIEVVVPVELASSSSIMSVRVLLQFPQCLHALPIASAVPDGGGNTVCSLTGGVTNIDVTTGTIVYVKGNSGIPDGAYSLLSVASGSITIGAGYGTFTGTGGSIFYYPLAGDPRIPYGENPVWALMDLLCSGPFTVADFDTLTWYNAAQVCAQAINYTDINNNPATHARYRCSFVLSTQTRQSLAKAVLGVRNCAGIILARNPANGLLQCYIEQTLADQQPNSAGAIPGSNYTTPVASLTAANTLAYGQLAYLFDGAGSIEKGTFKIGGRTLNDTPNTVSFQFPDSANTWQTDSITDIDPDGYVTSGNQEIQSQFQVLGIENFDQGIRRGNVELAKSLYCNTRFDAGGSELISFRSTVKAAHLLSRIGYICGINYQQLGL